MIFMVSPDLCTIARDRRRGPIGLLPLPPLAHLFDDLSRRNRKRRPHISVRQATSAKPLQISNPTSLLRPSADTQTPSQPTRPKATPHKRRKKNPNSPIRMINLRLPPQQLLLPCQIRPMPPHQIPILFRLQHRYEMDPRPHLLARKLAVTMNEHRLALLVLLAPGGGGGIGRPNFFSLIPCPVLYSP